MMEPVLDLDADGRWTWTHPTVEVDGPHDEAVGAARAGAEALRSAVEDGRLTSGEAAEVASDARFALASHEHGLSGADAPALGILRDLEDALRDQAQG